MASVLLLLAAFGIASAVMIYTEGAAKRGCGRGCASCGNREICHRRRRTRKKRK